MARRLKGIYYSSKPRMCCTCGSTATIFYYIVGIGGCSTCVNISSLEHGPHYIDTCGGDTSWYCRVILLDEKLAKDYDKDWVPNHIRAIVCDHIYRHKL